MRRLFHGRMITVDGHMRRMEPDYNQYAIVINTKRAYQLENKGLTSDDYMSTRITAKIPTTVGSSFSVKPTETGYQVNAYYMDGEYTVIGSDIGWATSLSVTMPSGSIALGVILAVGSAHTADLKPGDCGLLITEE